jgi:pilus assembly protein Flp/PilA
VERLHSFALRFLVAKEDGQAMVEYALILFLVSIVSIAVLSTLGGTVSSVFDEITQGF